MKGFSRVCVAAPNQPLHLTAAVIPVLPGS